MTARRLICALALLSFLPVSVGCSTSRTLLVEDDPVDSEAATRFQAGKAIEITGYTRPDDGFRDWEGIVQKVPPDSLQFTQQRENRNPGAAPSFRLAMTDVISIDALEFSSNQTAGLVIAGLFVVGIAVTAIIGYQISKMNLSMSS